MNRADFTLSELLTELRTLVSWTETALKDGKWKTVLNHVDEGLTYYVETYNTCRAQGYDEPQCPFPQYDGSDAWIAAVERWLTAVRDLAEVHVKGLGIDADAPNVSPACLGTGVERAPS